MPTLNFTEIVQQMLAASGDISHLIFSPGRRPQIKSAAGYLSSPELPTLQVCLPSYTHAIAEAMFTQAPTAQAALDKSGTAEFSFSVPGVSRFRVSIFRQRGTLAIVMRLVPSVIPTFQDLGLPPSLTPIAELKHGLVIVAGLSGSGRSSTLAALLNLINATAAVHIVTVEDQIEWVHKHNQATIHQREIPSDVSAAAPALAAALHQAPNVIALDALRDRESLDVLLEAADTGHLVLVSLRARDAQSALDAIVSYYPGDQHAFAWARLAATLRFVLAQRLIPRAGQTGRALALEIFETTPRTRRYLVGPGYLSDALQNSPTGGMVSFDQSIEALFRAQIVSMDDALSFATSRQALAARLTDLPREQDREAGLASAASATAEADDTHLTAG